MKKASKMAGLLLPLVMAMIMLGGCPNGTTDDPDAGYQNPKQLTTEWQLFYIKTVDASRSDFKNLSGLERWHFHNNTYDKPVGLEIQKIFVSSTKSATIPSDAVMVVDFTKDDYAVETYDPPFSETGIWSFTSGPDGKATTGTRNDSDYKYLGNVGTSAGAEAVYWGFVIRNVSATATAESLNLTLMGTNLDTQTANRPVNLGWLLGLDSGTEPEPPDPPEPVVVADWTPVYYHITDAEAQSIHLHVEAGSLEIQKIFLNSAAFETGATTLFDFTASPSYTTAENGGNIWWTTSELDAKINNGKYSFTHEGGYTYAGGFGSPLLAADQYIGFIIKSSDLGSFRFEVAKGDPKETIAIVNFADILESAEPEPEPSDWTTVYAAIPATAGIDIFNFHGENGHIEIQKIFVSATATATGAVTLFDFTATPAWTSTDNGGNVYAWATLDSRVVDGGTAAGRWVYELSGTYQHGGGFGTPSVVAAGASAYLGFIIKTNATGLGNIRLEIGSGTFVHFSAMEGAQ